MTFWYRLCWWICRIGLFFWHPVLHVHGRELVPAGCALLCANHSGMADPIWIMLALNSPKMIRILAKEELRRVPFLGWVMEKFDIIFVQRGAHQPEVYEKSTEALRAGDKLLVFVEGTRCNGDKHVRAKTGAVHMALESGAPVVPVYVTRNRTPFCPVDVYFGAPYKIEDISQSDRAACHAAADAMLETIYKLGGDGHADLSGKDSGLLLRG